MKIYHTFSFLLFQSYKYAGSYLHSLIHLVIAFGLSQITKQASFEAYSALRSLSRRVNSSSMLQYTPACTSFFAAGSYQP